MDDVCGKHSTSLAEREWLVVKVSHMFENHHSAVIHNTHTEHINLFYSSVFYVQ